MKAFKQVLSKNPRRVVGLMSGTSCDGVDVAIVLIKRDGEGINLTLEGFFEFPFEDVFRQRLHALTEVESCRIDDLCAMNFRLAEKYAEAINMAFATMAISTEQIDLIGSHGQTVHHLPEQGATLQIGEPAILAEAFHVPVIADFRTKDMAVQGQGAPLVPYVDFLLFRDTQTSRSTLNLGGIANLTYLPSGCTSEEVIGFDTGPANMVIDGVMQHLSHGAAFCDIDGKMAAQGSVDRLCLQTLLEHPFFFKEPPKSAGREIFGAEYVNKVINVCKNRGLGPEDLVATVTALTVESIVFAYEKFIYPVGPVDELILSGGGALNPTLINGLKERLNHSKIYKSDEFGIPAIAKEAICFAVLADETLEGHPNNLPSVTGAKRPVVLGKIVMPN